ACGPATHRRGGRQGRQAWRQDCAGRLPPAAPLASPSSGGAGHAETSRALRARPLADRADRVRAFGGRPGFDGQEDLLRRSLSEGGVDAEVSLRRVVARYFLQRRRMPRVVRFLPGIPRQAFLPWCVAFATLWAVWRALFDIDHIGTRL